MRLIRRAGVGLVVVTLVASLTGASTASGAAGASRRSGAGSQRLEWASCGPQLDCATVTLPLDWARPGGPQISLPVARHRASHPEHRIGSLFVNPGGPGDSGVEMVATRG